MGYDTSDDISLEPLFNNELSDADGLQRTLRVTNIKNAVEGYQISDQESGATSYYGYLDRDGNWYIMQAVIAGAVTTYRYYKASGGYAAGWAGRGALVYGYFDAIF